MLPGQMSTWQLESVQDGPNNLLLKFGKNRISNSRDITDVEFVWVGGVGWYAESFSFSNPTLVELLLSCRWVGGLKIIKIIMLKEVNLDDIDKVDNIEYNFEQFWHRFYSL